MKRRTLLVLVLLGLVMSGCGKSTTPQTRTILVDNKTDVFNGAFLGYYPSTLEVHAGDTIDFKEMWSGEPHTVTMGSLVDDGLAAQDKVKGDEPAPAYAKLPAFATDDLKIDQTAAQPCFMTSGDPSSLKGKPCAKSEQPDFDGKQAYYNSGFLPEHKTFTVKLANSISPGKYRFYCNLHQFGMQGSFTVVSTDNETPTQDDVDKSAARELKKAVDKVKPAVDQARAGKSPFPNNNAGFGVEGADSTAVNEFIPTNISAKVGEKVTWSVVGFHTIAFGAPADIGADTLIASDGTVSFNPKAFAPAGGPPAVAKPDPNAKGISVNVVDAGPYDGTGFKSSGAGDSFPPNLAGYSVTFTKAGRYTFVCLLHPGMAGAVEVK